MSVNSPEMIYRYQTFNSLSLDALCHDQLYFSDPHNFNDPLDCKPSVECDSDKSTLRAILKALIQKRVEGKIINSLKDAKLEGENGEAHARRQAVDSAEHEIKNIAYQATNPEYEEGVDETEFRLLTNEIQRELLKQNDRGVCCFSEEFNNPLLWSHYGNQHNGFCVGYSLDRNPAPKIKRVEYGGERTIKTNVIAKSILDQNNEARRIVDCNMLLRKAEPWKYEKEWRIFDLVGLQDSPLKLEEVIFGLRCSNAIIHSVISALKPRNIKYYLMYSVAGSFELKRTDDIGEIRAYFPRTAYSGIEMFGPVE